MQKKLIPLSLRDKEKIIFLDTFYNKMRDFFYQSMNTAEKQIKKRYYHCIPSYSVSKALLTIRKNFPTKLNFLDVGAGYGHIAELANTVGFRAEGIEYSNKNDMNKIHHSCMVRVLYSVDAFNKKKEFYEKYDIIYFYQPICDSRLCDKLYAHVINNSKKGTVFILIGAEKIFKELTTELKFKNSEDFLSSRFFIKE